MIVEHIGDKWFERRQIYIFSKSLHISNFASLKKCKDASKHGSNSLFDEDNQRKHYPFNYAIIALYHAIQVKVCD